IAILIVFADKIIPTLGLILSNAFRREAVAGGVLGYTIKSAIRYGVARGLFSNEAGMGSTPNSHGVADVKHPAIQGAVAMVGVFID
ncbi:alanine:cation symporter family protein, partial [Alloscardovia omnicolens]